MLSVLCSIAAFIASIDMNIPDFKVLFRNNSFGNRSMLFPWASFSVPWHDGKQDTNTLTEPGAPSYFDRIINNLFALGQQ